MKSDERVCDTKPRLLHATYLSTLPHGQSYSDLFELAARAGIDGVEMKDISSPEIQGELMAATAKTGVKIHCVVPQGLRINPLCSGDPDQVRRGVDDILNAIQTANKLRAETVLLIAGPASRDMDNAECLSRMGEVIKRDIVPVAERLGIDIGIENVQDGAALDPHAFAGFIDSFESARVRAVLDVGNIYSGNAAEWVDILGPRISKLHVKDFVFDAAANKVKKKKIGEGSIDWPAVRRALARIEFRGWATSAEAKAHIIARVLNRIAHSHSFQTARVKFPTLVALLKVIQDPFATTLLKDLDRRVHLYVDWEA